MYAVGQQVGFCRRGGWGIVHSVGISNIATISESGDILLENGRVFDADGLERRDWGLSLISVEEAEALLAGQELIKTQRKTIDSIMHILTNNASINSSLKTKLLEMVNSL